MLFTNPVDMPVFVLFAPFVLFGFSAYRTWLFLVAAYSSRSKTGDSVPTRNQRIGGIVLSIIVVVLLGLQSLGELTVRDILTVIIFAIGAYFYFARNVIRE